MNISNVQLERLATAFDVHMTEDVAAVTEACFEKSYLACRQKKWHLIEPFRIELSLLQDKVGHTLLLRALLQGEKRIVIGLSTRKIAVLTPDRQGYTPLCYIKAGVCSENFWQYVHESAIALTDRLPEEELLERIEMMNQELDEWRYEAAKAFAYGGYEGAKILNERILDWYERHWGKRHPKVVISLVAQGLVHERLGDFLKAIDSFEEAIKLTELFFGNESPDLLFPLAGAGRICLSIPDQNTRGRNFYKRGLKLALKLRAKDCRLVSAHMVAQFYGHLGLYYEKNRDYEMGVGLLTRATIGLCAWQICDVDFNEIQDLLVFQAKLANCHYELKEYQEGISTILRAMEVSEILFGASHVTNTDMLIVLGKCYLKVSQYSESRECFFKAQVALERIYGKDSLPVADMHDALRDVCIDNHDYVAGIRRAELALKIYKKHPNCEPKVRRLLSVISQLSMQTGDFSNAEAYLKEHEQLNQTTLGEKDEENIMLHMGFSAFYQHLGLKKKSRDHAQRLVELCGTNQEFSDLKPEILTFVTDEPEVLREERAYYLKALHEEEQRGIPGSESSLLASLIRLSFSLNQQKEGKKHLKRLEENLRKDLVPPEDKLNCLPAVAIARYQLREYDKALEFAIDSVTLVQRTDMTLMPSVLTMLGMIYFRQKNYPQADDSFRKAVGVCEGIRLQEDSERWKISSFDSQYLIYVQLEYSLLMQSIDVSGLEALKVSDLRRANSLAAILRRQLALEKTAVCSFNFRNILEVAKVQSATLLLFSGSQLGLGFINVWGINARGEIRHIRIPASDIKSRHEMNASDISFPFKLGDDESSPISPIEKVVSDLEKISENKGGLIEAELQQKRQKLRDQFKQQLKKWYEVLIKPIEGLLPPEGGNIVLIPDQNLLSLPFSLFLRTEGVEERFLFQDYTVSLTPSIAVLDLLQKRRETQDISSSMLIIDDPLCSGIKTLLTGGEESSRLLHQMKGEKTKVLSGKEASVEEALSHMKGAGRLHLSCHASPSLSTDSDLIYQGGFYLAKDDAHPNGVLFAEDIVKAKISMDLVFTSACSTGLGNMQKDGVIGLVRAFLLSGASTVIASQWRVADTDLTVQIVEYFYTCLVKKRLSKAESLKQAMLHGMSLDPEAIEKWGVFFLTGLA